MLNWYMYILIFLGNYNMKLLADDVRRTNTSVTDIQRSTGGGARLEMVPAPTWKFKFFIFWLYYKIFEKGLETPPFPSQTQLSLVPLPLEKKTLDPHMTSDLSDLIKGERFSRLLFFFSSTTMTRQTTIIR